jgi:hypothetical protein
LYWDTSVSTRWPSHSMIWVSGRSVTSVRNGFPSTWPSIRSESCDETGNSGLVMFVGSENVGISRSTRSLSGATGIWAGTICCGIVVTVAPLEPVGVPEVDSLGPEGEVALLSLVHAAATNATVTPSTSRRRRNDRPRRPSNPPSPCMTSSVARIGPGQLSFEPSWSFDPSSSAS